jgi:hypothetical protein
MDSSGNLWERSYQEVDCDTTTSDPALGTRRPCCRFPTPIRRRQIDMPKRDINIRAMHDACMTIRIVWFLEFQCARGPGNSLLVVHAAVMDGACDSDLAILLLVHI